MPVYEYECKKCKAIQECIYHIEERLPQVKCKKCGGTAVRVLSLGGIQCDSAGDITWMPSALKVLQRDHEKPIETRGEYKRYLKDNKLIATG